MPGKASSKSWLSFKLISALLLSLTCLVFAVLTVTPSVSFSWHLEFKNQIIIIGFLLSVQGLCLRTVAPVSFTLLEARFGTSMIQNYDAILRSEVLGKHVQRRWRIAISVLGILPAAMGISYKRFIGGTSSMTFPGDKYSDTRYGLAFPNLGQYASLSNSVYLSMNANSGFLNASRFDQEYPPKSAYPLKYGYNTLVIGEDSAALLDMPLAANISNFQSQFSTNETWRISAAVDAVVATRNTSIDRLRYDQDFLNQTMGHAYNGFASADLFQNTTGLGFGWISVSDPQIGDAYCLMGGFGNKSVRASSPIGLTRSTSDEGFQNFMETAQMFSIRRRTCQGIWSISRSDVRLVEGTCDLNNSAKDQGPSSKFLHDGQTSPFALDVLPVLVNTVAPYTTIRPLSRWKPVSYVVAAANMWWARSAFLNFGTPDTEWLFRHYPETRYVPQNQTITSTKQTIDANWGLYVVLTAMPFVTLLLWTVTLFLHSTPIDVGFGLVSILAGIDQNSLDLVQGAGLSGELDGPVKLDISADNTGSPHKIGYALSDQPKRRPRTKLVSGQEYE